ncbi:MAG: hypothetical protein K0R67_887 [Paenibacillus sp.]|nr:hypothetical protein [Paenibacillus sp.]
MTTRSIRTRIMRSTILVLIASLSVGLLFPMFAQALEIKDSAFLKYDLENLSLGAIQGQDSWAGSTNAKAATNLKFSGIRSLELKDTSSSSYEFASRPVPQSGAGILEFYARASQTNALVTFDMLSGVNTAISVGFGSNGKFVRESSAGTFTDVSAGSYVTGRWYCFTISYDLVRGKYNVYIYDMTVDKSKLSYLTFPDDYAPLTTDSYIDNIQVETTSAQTGTVYFDNIAVYPLESRIVDEGFEGYTVGNLNNQGAWTVSGSSVTVESGTGISGAQHAKIMGNATTDVYARKNLYRAGYSTSEVWVNPSQTNRQLQIIGYSDHGSLIESVKVGFGANGNFFYYDDTLSVDTGIAYSTDTWYRLRVSTYGSKYGRYYVFEVSNAAGAAVYRSPLLDMRNSSSDESSYLDIIEIRTPAGGSSSFKFDEWNGMTYNVLLNQSFEGIVTGNAIDGQAGWWGTTNSKIVDNTSSVLSSGGNKVLKIEDTSTSLIQSTGVTFPGVTSMLYEFWLKATSTTDILYMEVKDGSNQAVRLALASNGKFGYYDGSTYVSTTTNYVADTWYRIALTVDATDKTYDYYVYDRAGTQLVKVNNIQFTNTSMSTINYIGFSTNSTKQGTYYVDDIKLSNTGSFQTRSTFDYIDQLGTNGDWFKNNNDEFGTLAWGENAVMLAYLEMYETTWDTTYLDKFISHADAVLNQRDSVRGVTDYNGDSLAAWRSGSRYTLAEKVLKDTGGSDVLRVKSVRNGDSAGGTGTANDNNSIYVRVTTGTNPGSFKLNIFSHTLGVDTTYDNLNMDNTSPDYALTRINDRLVVLEDLAGAGTSNPVNMAQDEPLEAKYMYLLVDNAFITVPYARYVDLVYNNPSLSISGTYKSKADTYKTAVKTVLSYFDSYWTDNPADNTEGYFTFASGSPIWADGVDEPLNRLAAIGMAYLYINHAEADTVYLERASKMANLFKQDLELRTVTVSGATYDYYYWTYWDQDLYGYKGWTTSAGISSNTKSYGGHKAIEDVSHAQLDINFAYLAYKLQLKVVNTTTPVFNLTDMQRFANNYTKKIILTDGRMSSDVVGGNGISANYVAEWLLLSEFDPDVYFKTKDLIDQKDYWGTTRALRMSALLNWAKPSILLQAESLPASASPGHSLINYTDTPTGRIYKNLNADAVGDYAEYTVNIPSPGTYSIYIGNRVAYEKGIYQLAIDGTSLGGTIDNYSSVTGFTETNQGNATFSTSGNKTFRFTVTGKNASSSGYRLGYDYIKLVKQ